VSGPNPRVADAGLASIALDVNGHRSPAPRLLFSTAAFFGQPLRTAFRHIASAGFESVEVMVTNDPASQEPHLIADAAREFGLSVEALHAPFLLLTRKVWGTDPVQKIYRTVDVAEHVGASLVVVHPPYRWQPAYRRWLDERLPGFVERTGVTVAVENMFPLRLSRERAMRFHAGGALGDLERFGAVVLDTSHAAVSGDDVREARRRLRERLVHVHLSNNAGRGWDSHLPVEEGVLPIGELLEDLATDGFGGTISLELDLRAHMGSEERLREILVRQRGFCEQRLAGWGVGRSRPVGRDARSRGGALDGGC
jgi:sugar phosphate isomerase/epimerase